MNNKNLFSLVLGVVFVVSGFVKAIDLMGFSYKIEEYLSMFQFSDWGILSVCFAVLLCAAEMMLGLLLLLRLWRRITLQASGDDYIEYAIV